MPHLTGWINEPTAVAESLARMESAGRSVSFAATRSELKGYWQSLVERGSTGVFLQDAETELFGQTQPAFHQQIGSCVSMGTARAIQDTAYWALAQRGDIGRPVQIATEPIYAGSRIEIGHGQLGHGDGSIGAWAAEWVHNGGMLARGVYGQIDLTQLRDDLASEWGAPGCGVPAELEAECRTHLVGACHKLDTVVDMADAIAAGHAVAYCCGRIRGKPNAAGYAASDSNGGHCTEIQAVLLDTAGRLAFVEQQSWGNYPDIAIHLQFQGGVKVLRQGSYGVYGDDLSRCLDQGGEAWCFDQVALWRPNSLEEMQ